VNWGLFIPTIYGEFGDGWLVNMNSHTWDHVNICECIRVWPMIEQKSVCVALVGGIPTPLKNMSSSVGMILPNWMESHKSHVPNHQPAAILTRIHRMFPRPQEPGCSFCGFNHRDSSCSPALGPQSSRTIAHLLMIYLWFSWSFSMENPEQIQNVYSLLVSQQWADDLTQLPCVVFSS
jgi:hypothetical protein